MHESNAVLQYNSHVQFTWGLNVSQTTLATSLRNLNETNESVGFTGAKKMKWDRPTAAGSCIPKFGYPSAIALPNASDLSRALCLASHLTPNNLPT